MKKDSPKVKLIESDNKPGSFYAFPELAKGKGYEVNSQFFEQPLPLEAAIKFQHLREVYSDLDTEEFLKEIKASTFWAKFKPKYSNLTAEMSDQWARQQESLIYLTRCLLMIRSLSHGCQSSGDLAIDALRAEAARKAINELADAAHNLPTVISNSMMHFVTLESGHLIKVNLDQFNHEFEVELCGLKRQLQMGLGEAPVSPFQIKPR